LIERTRLGANLRRHAPEKSDAVRAFASTCQDHADLLVSASAFAALARGCCSAPINHVRPADGRRSDHRPVFSVVVIGGQWFDPWGRISRLVRLGVSRVDEYFYPEALQHRGICPAVLCCWVKAWTDGTAS